MNLISIALDYNYQNKAYKLFFPIQFEILKNFRN
jgi:hypothetical protein